MQDVDMQAFIAHIESILKEQILEMGEDPDALEPQEYAKQMRCEVYPDESMVYLWRDMPILRLVPEKQPSGSIYWRMFTADERSQIAH